MTEDEMVGWHHLLIGHVMLTLVFSDYTYIALIFIMTHAVSPRF